MNFRDLTADVTTVDAQESLKGGVTVLATGSLTGKYLVKKHFVHYVFLAPQETGYFVLNDIFRYVDPSGRHSKNGKKKVCLRNSTDSIDFSCFQ